MAQSLKVSEMQTVKVKKSRCYVLCLSAISYVRTHKETTPKLFEIISK